MNATRPWLFLLAACTATAVGGPGGDGGTNTPDSTVADGSDDGTVSDSSIDTSVGDGGVSDGSATDSSIVIDGGGETDAMLPGMPCDGAQTGLELTANIHTIGIVLERAGLESVDGLQTQVMGPDGMWRAAHAPVFVRNGMIASSVFYLQGGTPYAVRMGREGAWTCGTTRTQPEVIQSQVMREVYVRAGASGDGSMGSPYGTIQAAVSAARAGDRIHVAAGTYHESVTVNVSGAAGRYIQIVADEGVIMDGTTSISNWTADGTNMWRAPFQPSTFYVGRDNERSYHYTTLQHLRDREGDGGGEQAPPTYEEGWFQDERAGVMYVRSPRPPAASEWRIADLPSAFIIEGDYILIEGFTLRFYGQGERPLVDVAGGDYAVIQRNVLVGGANGIFVHDEGSNRANHVRVTHNDISDPPIDEWAFNPGTEEGEARWHSVKATLQEVSAIVFNGSTGAIAWRNHIHHHFNGIYTGEWERFEDEQLARDVDAYENPMELICDDTFEPEGTSINNRFHHNVVRDILVGTSTAPVTRGPVWLMYNTIASFTGTPFKWGYASNGRVLLYHNSAQTFVAGLPALSYYTDRDPVTGEYRPNGHGTYLNNIVVGTDKLINHSYPGQGDILDYNVWFADRRAEFFWNTNYVRERFCSELGFECHGYVENPMLTSPREYNYTPRAGSPAIDHGVVIPGINDGFAGAAPDIGAIETR